MGREVVAPKLLQVFRPHSRPCRPQGCHQHEQHLLECLLPLRRPLILAARQDGCSNAAVHFKVLRVGADPVFCTDGGSGAVLALLEEPLCMAGSICGCYLRPLPSSCLMDLIPLVSLYKDVQPLLRQAPPSACQVLSFLVLQQEVIVLLLNVGGEDGVGPGKLARTLKHLAHAAGANCTLEVIHALMQVCGRLETADFLQLQAGCVDHVMHAVPLVAHRQVCSLGP
mmetsp:Transcript_19712/g.55029  ORF Transcript_19712/g.55029 Transcript_19712/m.55029 type:complete len:226 (-) Transcript_19712:4056-4733(-)